MGVRAVPVFSICIRFACFFLFNYLQDSTRARTHTRARTDGVDRFLLFCFFFIISISFIFSLLLALLRDIVVDVHPPKRRQYNRIVQYARVCVSARVRVYD